jgi:V8-like Glu-specific endopeptidase
MGFGKCIKGYDRRVKIADTLEYPYSTIGIIAMRHRGGDYKQGTGFLIAPNIVLTCAHNLYDIFTKKTFYEINFYPAVNGQEGTAYKVKKVYYKK